MSSEQGKFGKALAFISIQYIVSFVIVTFFKPDYGLVADFIINLSFYLIVIVLPVMAAIRIIYKARPLDYMGFSQNTGNGLLYGILICLFISVIFFAVNRFSIRLADFSGGTMLMLAGLMLAGLFEEIPFRGFYLNVFKERFGFWPANLISSSMFAALHLSRALSEGLFQIAIYFVLSLWLGYIYEKSKSLWAPILVHACYNLLTALF